MKKWAIWALLLFSLVVTYFVIWIQINELHKYGVKFVDSINIYTKMMPFIFGISFISMIIVYVFKDGEDDGSDLLIISKPISRGKILLGKFAVIAIFIFAYNLIYFGLVFVAAQADEFASMKEKLLFSVSILIGGIVVSFIVGTIIIFAASFLSKMGALAVGIVSAAVVPIVSQVVVAVSKGIPLGSNSGFKKNLHLINARETENLLENTIVNYAETGNAGVQISDLLNIDKRQMQIQSESELNHTKEYIGQVWYDKAAYVDPWYQLSGFYDLFTERPFLSDDPEELVLSREASHVSEGEALETTTGGNRVAVPVDVMTGDALNPEEILMKTLKILSGEQKALILTKNDYPLANGHHSTVPWTELRDNLQKWHKALPMGDEFEETPIINFFTDSKYAFEDRVRAIATVDDFDEDKGKLKNRVSDVRQYNLTEYLTHVLVLDALKHKDNFLAKLNAMAGVTPQIQAAANLIVSSLKPYQKPNKVFDFYQPHGNPDLATGDINDENTGYLEYLKHAVDSDGDPLPNSLIANHMKTFLRFEPTGLVIDGVKQWRISTKPYVSRGRTLEIWGFIGLFFMLITGIRYWRKDIK